MTYEGHITVSTKHTAEATDVAAACGWKTSEIARDPVLGDDTFFYLTKHSTRYTRMYRDMKQAVEMLDSLDVPVLREKIEHIIFDTKAGDI